MFEKKVRARRLAFSEALNYRRGQGKSKCGRRKGGGQTRCHRNFLFTSSMLFLLLISKKFLDFVCVTPI